MTDKLKTNNETDFAVRLLRWNKQQNTREMPWKGEKDPYKINFDEVKYIVPVFSLFGKDTQAKRDQPLLEQIIKLKAADPTAFVLEQLIFPMIDCYFNLIKNSGIQPEWHAQNLLVGLTKDFSPVNFIMRDLESMDKDITLMESINLNVQFHSHPFKCIWKDQWNYQIKHSFMYDYKFGEYILQPLLNFLNISFKVETLSLLQDIKLYSKRLIDDFPEDFFPKEWYVFERILIDQSTNKRPYVKMTNPKFRF